MILYDQFSDPHLQTFYFILSCRHSIKVDWLKCLFRTLELCVSSSWCYHQLKKNSRTSCSLSWCYCNLFKKVGVCYSILFLSQSWDLAPREKVQKMHFNKSFLTSWSLGMTTQNKNNVLNQPQGKSFLQPFNSTFSQSNNS